MNVHSRRLRGHTRKYCKVHIISRNHNQWVLRILCAVGEIFLKYQPFYAFSGPFFSSFSHFGGGPVRNVYCFQGSGGVGGRCAPTPPLPTSLDMPNLQVRFRHQLIIEINLKINNQQNLCPSSLALFLPSFDNGVLSHFKPH